LKDFSEKVSYLQGLSEGLNISEGSPQGKIISGMLNVLNEMAEEITTMQQDFDEMKEYVESIDDDLFELEESVLDDDFMEIECSSCGEKLYVENDIFEDDDDVIEIICPRCNEVVFVNDGSFDFDPINLGDDLEDKNH
jgi:NAD-dependent SIR2 family protein deacetylase